MRIRPAPIALGAVGLALGVAAVLALREATLSTHQRVPEDSTTELVLEASTKGGERNQTLDEMVEALVLACRLEVSSDLVAPMVARGDGVYEGTLRPALDQTNTRQMRGCLEDWSIDHLRVDVLRLRRS